MREELRMVYDAYDIVEKHLKKKGAQLDVRTKQFVVRYAMVTGNLNQVEGMLDEFLADHADRYDIAQKYEAKLHRRIPLVQSMENLLIAAEMYRIEESKALVRVQQILAEQDISMTIEQLREADGDVVKRMLLQKKGVLEKEMEEKTVSETLAQAVKNNPNEPKVKTVENNSTVTPVQDVENNPEENPQEEDFLEDDVVEETKMR